MTTMLSTIEYFNLEYNPFVSPSIDWSAFANSIRSDAPIDDPKDDDEEEDLDEWDNEQPLDPIESKEVHWSDTEEDTPPVTEATEATEEEPEFGWGLDQDDEDNY